MKMKLHQILNFLRMKDLAPMERNIRLMYLYMLFSKMQFSAPIEAIYFAAVAGDFTRGMSVYAIAYMIGTLLNLPMGVLSDAIGRQKMIVLCAFARLCATVLYAIAPSYSMLVSGAVVYGVYRALSSTNNDALVYESVIWSDIKDKTNEVMARYRAMSPLGLSVGSLMSGVFVLISLKAAMIATIFPMTIAFSISLFLTNPTMQKKLSTFENPFKHIKNAFVFLKKNKKLGLFMIADASYFGLNEATFSFNGNFFKTIIPEWSLGILRFCGHLANTVTNWFAAKVSAKIGIEKSILWFAALDNVLNVLSALCSNWISPVLKTVASGSYGIYSPASCVYLQKNVSNQERVTLLSIASLLNCGVYSAGSLLVGKIADLTTPATTIFVGYGLALCSNLLYVWAFQKNKKTIIQK